MKNLAMSLPPQIGSSSASDLSTPQHPNSPNSQTNSIAEYATERARFLFGQYRKGDANDPDTYVAGVAAVLSEYPAVTIRYVTDPRTGIAANPLTDPETGRVWTGMPDLANVKRACEIHHSPTRRLLAQRKQADESARLRLESERLDADRKSRPTYDELAAKCAADGIMIGPYRGKAQMALMSQEAFCKKFDIKPEDFAAIPDAK